MRRFNALIAWSSHVGGISQIGSSARLPLAAVPPRLAPGDRDLGSGGHAGRLGRAIGPTATSSTGPASGAAAVDAGRRSDRARVRCSGRAVRAWAQGDRHRGLTGGVGPGAGDGKGRVLRPGGGDQLGHAPGRSWSAGHPRPAARPGGHRRTAPTTSSGRPGRPRTYPPAGGAGRVAGGSCPPACGSSRAAGGAGRVGGRGDSAPGRAGERHVCRSSAVPGRPAEAAAGATSGTWWSSGRLTGAVTRGSARGSDGAGVGGLCYRPRRARCVPGYNARPSTGLDGARSG
jgi:hypothetical protein